MSALEAVGIRRRAGSIYCRKCVVLFAAMLVLGACTSGMKAGADAAAETKDIHERLSESIAADGFSHRIVSDRTAHTHHDSIHLRIPLDGMKRRHEGVRKLLGNIARICALPEYSALPIRIVVATADEEDGEFLRAVMDQEAGGRKNVSFEVNKGSGGGIVIAVTHPPLNSTLR